MSIVLLDLLQWQLLYSLNLACVIEKYEDKLVLSWIQLSEMSMNILTFTVSKGSTRVKKSDEEPETKLKILFQLTHS